MQTQTHAVLAWALFSKSAQEGGNRSRNWAIFLGAMATDAFIYISFLWHVPIGKQSASKFFNITYFQPPTQLWSAISNSLPLYALLAALGYVNRKRTVGSLLLVFALAGFSQSLIDIPVHASDAHRHFWPLSNFRFISPISYWDPQYYGRWISFLEALLALACITLLWIKFTGRKSRIGLALLAGLYALILCLTMVRPFI